ncbi:MAG: Glyceraldehyde-3-phosphate dehydrogenase [Parcubacteria group bacterium GW2011_GWA1_Parcubacteria_45_10]|nr:MAG: Glyceraldehyde-3-phosphate dehydrogenase [Parcubacteria group bacterium GW2011_GWA1_Parcubacteria_45_10]
MNQPLKIAINGFGRIGRLMFRLGFGDPDFEFAAINDLGDAQNLVYLLEHDSVYRKYQKEAKLETKEEKFSKTSSSSQLSVDSRKAYVFSEKDPLNLPWKELGIDLVIESTGAFESYEKAKVHLDAGAKRVLISAPAKDEDSSTGSEQAAGQVIGKTVLLGVNEEDLKACQISSNGSCTTNSAHPVIQILNEKLGVKKAMLSTVHALTSTQNIVDGPTKGSDFRRGRSGPYNIVPSTTGAATAVTRAVKELQGRFDGIAFRVPVACGSVSDITFLASRPTTKEEVNQILTDASKEPRWAKILRTTDEQLVSSDIIGEEAGAVVDLSMTKVVDSDLVKVLSWYDNEMGYTRTLLEHARAIKQIL